MKIVSLGVSARVNAGKNFFQALIVDPFKSGGKDSREPSENDSKFAMVIIFQRSQIQALALLQTNHLNLLGPLSCSGPAAVDPCLHNKHSPNGS
jgi:hypothetical protein